MGRSCCVSGCKNRFIKGGANKRVRFFGFPKDGTRRKEWFKFLGRSSGWIPRNQDAVCSVHFKDSCFNVQGGPKILKKIAIPSEVSPDIVSDSLLGVPDVEESFSVPKVMGDICPIPLTMVPKVDNSLSGASMGHFVIAESGGDTADANLDSSQIETSVALPSTRKRKFDLDEIMEIPEVKMMRLENEQLRNRISLLEKKLKAANRAKQYHEKKWLKLTNFFNDLNKLVPQKDLNEIMDQFQDLPFLCINEDPPKNIMKKSRHFLAACTFTVQKLIHCFGKRFDFLPQDQSDVGLQTSRHCQDFNQSVGKSLIRRSKKTKKSINTVL